MRIFHQVFSTYGRPKELSIDPKLNFYSFDYCGLSKSPSHSLMDPKCIFAIAEVILNIFLELVLVHIFIPSLSLFHFLIQLLFLDKTSSLLLLFSVLVLVPFLVLLLVLFVILFVCFLVLAHFFSLLLPLFLFLLSLLLISPLFFQFICTTLSHRPWSISSVVMSILKITWRNWHFSDNIDQELLDALRGSWAVKIINAFYCSIITNG